MRGHVIDGKARFELWDAASSFILKVDARLLTQSKLTRVGNHFVKADLAADLLKVVVLGMCQSAGEVNSVCVRDGCGVRRIDDPFIQSGQAGNQLDCGAGFKTFT